VLTRLLLRFARPLLVTGFCRDCAARHLSAFCLFLLCLFLPGRLISPVWAHTSGAQAQLFLTRRATPQEIAARNTHGKYEPANGCYLGAFIDFDPSLKRPLLDQNRTPHQDPAAFEEIVQKSHAMYFFYVGYGHPVPLDWIRWMGAHGKYVHVALEPNDGLKYVRDDAYLRKMADGFARSGAKIFLRFGSEMNGDWVAYNNPVQFRAKFKLVHDVMKKRAPNVAMVWCPYTFPRPGIEAYYPGDDATDWVGVNLYSVTYHNNDLKSPSEYEHPCDLLSWIYDKYAARKPFMICEFGATHYADCEARPRADFATRKIETLYMALPRLFPRVKAINYFDSNNIQFTDHAKNNYAVTDDPVVLASYRNAIRSPYFLDRPLPDNAPPLSAPVPMPLRKGELLKGNVELSCFARTPGDRPTARYKVDGIPIYKANQPNLWTCLWDAGSVTPGRHNLTLEVFSTKGKLVASQSLSIVTAR
jgi:hypothetical protein